jgi:predicted membrane-bound spermidine synthase
MVEQELKPNISVTTLPQDTVKIWLAYMLVFVSSFCLLTLELVAGRFMAPYIGTSIYNWTSVIGVALAGVSIGNWLGGRLADCWASFTLLRRLYWLGGFTSLFVIPLIAPVMTSAILVNLPVQLRILLSATILIFIPCTFFGTISPVVIKLALRNWDTAGSKVGSIYAVSTVGSIVGTFMTGFVMVALFGTTLIVWLIAATMVALGVVFCVLLTGQKPTRQVIIESVVVVALFLAISLPMAFSGSLQGPCFKESEYFCIRIVDGQSQDGRPAKALVLDQLVHNFIVPGDLKQGGYGYESVYGDIARWMNERNQKIDLLVVGAGAFSFPRYVRLNYPNSTVDAIEIDPQVVEVTHTHFDLPRNTDINIFVEDARYFLNRDNIKGKYSLIQGDAFMDVSVPYHLTTYEFNERIQNALKPDGIYMVTMIESGTNGRYLRSYLQTLRKTFKQVYLYEPGGMLERSTRSTFVVVATNRPDMTTPPPSGWRIVPTPELDSYIAKGDWVYLTDTYAPTDILLLPVIDRAIDRTGSK